MINVTQPFLPPLKEFEPYLQKIWENAWVTNNGPFHQEFENALCQHLGVDYISLFANGTLALLTGLESLEIHGEVITTPYSFVATSHALLWNNLKPVFIDIDPDTFNLDPRKIEAAITPHTSAILAVHCYGTPCETEAIREIAHKYRLKVMYDAAHAFGIEKNNRSILNEGDLSILSFHATKVFNTFEGGAIVCRDAKQKAQIDKLKNFGFVDEITVNSIGINGKMSEINAAFGLLQLKYIDQAIARRRAVAERYHASLASIKGLTIPQVPKGVKLNYSYFPILIGPDYPLSRDELHTTLKANQILARRYFYPLISNFPPYQGIPSASQTNLPNASKLAQEIICLPIHPMLDESDVDKIIFLLQFPKSSF